jgi:rubrerythrin
MSNDIDVFLPFRAGENINILKRRGPMEQLLTADEVFGIGIEIEKNGFAFYQAASSTSAGSSIKKLLGELAAWEKNHVALFTELKKNLPAAARNENLYDPGDEIGMYLKATADQHVFIRNSDMNALAAKCKTPQEILAMALTFEKDSVVFYASVREAVAETGGKADVEKLIHEELTHIGFITRELQKIKARV